MYGIIIRRQDTISRGIAIDQNKPWSRRPFSQDAVEEEHKASTLNEWEQEERGWEVIQEVGPLRSLGKDRIEPCVRHVMCVSDA